MIGPRLSWLLLLAAAAGCGGPAIVSAPIVRGPLVGRVGATELTVAWHQTVAAPAVVRYGPTADCAQSVSHTVDDPGWQQVRLTGLAPGAAVHYQLLVGGRAVTQPTAVRTAPGKPGRVRLAVIGDSGSGRTAQHRVAAAVLAAGPDLVLHTGDVVYPDGADAGYPARFFTPYRALLAAAPMYLSLGNHDVRSADGAPLLANGPLLPRNDAGHSRWYVVRRGGHRLIALDSTRLGDEFVAQRAWLEATLAQPNPDGWTVVFLHHPLYTVMPPRAANAQRRRKQLQPLFERLGVDLVLAGHDHYYHRTHPVSQGGRWSLVHVTSGGGGAPLYHGTPRHPWSAAYRSVYHYVWVDLESRATLTLEARAVAPDTGRTETFETVKLTRTPTGTRTW